MSSVIVIEKESRVVIQDEKTELGYVVLAVHDAAEDLRIEESEFVFVEAPSCDEKEECIFFDGKEQNDHVFAG